MRKIIFCDKNERLVEKVKKAYESIQNTRIEAEFICGDVVKIHEKTPNSRIVTASNPDFNAGGGLDAYLASKYDWEDAEEFNITDDLFFVVSVDKNIQSSKTIIKRALAGVYAYSHEHIMILTGLGTSIGGLSVDDFIEEFRYFISANLYNANLRYADLSNANLRYADLSNADLYNADLRYADLSYAYLSNAYLGNADLSYADLSYANLRYAYLSNADLSYADLSYAYLSNANLSTAYLRYANLYKIVFNENTIGIQLVCPSEGSFIAWKKVHKHIIKLFIPAKAKRSSATTRKCRCSIAKVLQIFDEKGNKIKKVVNKVYDKETVYEVGKYVEPDRWDEDRWNECSNGIHFFITREEAEMWST